MTAFTFKEMESPITNAQAYKMDECDIILTKEKLEGQYRYHLCISHPLRDPTWREVKEARYKLTPDTVTMALVLPPTKEYIHIQRYCFHLWQI